MATRTRAATRTIQTITSPAATRTTRGITSKTSDSKGFIQSTDRFSTTSQIPNSYQNTSSSSRASSGTRYYHEDGNDNDEDDNSQDDESDHDDTHYRLSKQSQLNTASNSTRQYLHPSLQTPSSSSYSKHTTTNTNRDSISNHDQYPSTPSSKSATNTSTTSSTSQRSASSSSSSSSSMTSLSTWEQFKKSYNNPHLKPLYLMIGGLMTIVSLLLFILVTNRHVLTLPVLSPQRLAPRDPLLLTNGHFLTENDLLKLQQRFLTPEALQLDQQTQTNKLTELIKQDKAQLLDTINHAQADLPNRIGQYLEKTTQLNDKLFKKHDKLQFENFKSELMLELMELNKNVDELSQHDQSTSRDLEKTATKIVAIQTQLESLSTIQQQLHQEVSTITTNSKTSSTNNTTTTTTPPQTTTTTNSVVPTQIQIETIIKDTTLTQHITNMISTQLTTLKAELIKNINDNEPKSTIPADLLEKITKMESRIEQMNQLESTTTEQIKLLKSVQTTQLQHGAGLLTMKAEYTQLKDKMTEWANEMDGKQTTVLNELRSTQTQLTRLSKQTQDTESLVTAATAQLSTRTQSTDQYINKNELLQYLQLYLNADQTGIIDFAHSSYGTRITANSAPFSQDKSSLIPFVNLYNTNSLFSATPSSQSCVETILNEVRGVGDSFVLAGRTGFVTLQFADPLFISHISLEHISSTIDPYPDATPRHIAVYGINPTDQREELLLEGEYQQPRVSSWISPNLGTTATKPTTTNTSDEFVPTVQTFKVLSQLATSKPYHSLKFEIRSNYGNKDFTKLYRIRVHGKPQKNKNDNH